MNNNLHWCNTNDRRNTIHIFCNKWYNTANDCKCSEIKISNFTWHTPKHVDHQVTQNKQLKIDRQIPGMIHTLKQKSEEIEM
jgi:hypothetical protein